MTRMKDMGFTDERILEAYFATTGDTFSDGPTWEASVVAEMRLILEDGSVAEDLIGYWHEWPSETPETWARRFRQKLGIVDKEWRDVCFPGYRPTP